MRRKNVQMYSSAQKQTRFDDAIPVRGNPHRGTKDLLAPNAAGLHRLFQISVMQVCAHGADKLAFKLASCVGKKRAGLESRSRANQ